MIEKTDWKHLLIVFRNLLSVFLTIGFAGVIHTAICIACSYGGIPPESWPPKSVYTVSLETTMLCVLMTVIMLNGVLSCLWTLRPGWSIVFALISIWGIVEDTGDLMFYTGVNALPALIYCLLALIASILSMIKRRREWGKESLREKPAAWIDALMYLSIYILFEHIGVGYETIIISAIALAFAARHIYIVHTLIRNRKNGV